MLAPLLPSIGLATWVECKMPSEQFPLNVCFPDPTTIFTRRYKSFDEISANCLIALDTNVLLAPYSLSDKDVAQISKIYEVLEKQNRLVISGQVAREFARNRSTKLGDLVKTLQDQMSRLASPLSTRFSFLHLLPEYRTVVAIAEDIEAKQKDLSKHLKILINNIKSWDIGDPVWDIYRRHFGNSIVELEEVEQNKIEAELKFRNLHNIPPGYKDEKKADGGAGDLIIWKTLIQVSNSEKQIWCL
jgi:hypothetical protein